MRFELRKYNIEAVKKALEGVQGKNIMINNTLLSGVVSIEIAESTMYDSDPIPEEGYDGGKKDFIDIIFNFENGNATHSFCPDEERCQVRFETEDLWIFITEDAKQFIERERHVLDLQFKEHEEYMLK